LQEQWDQETEFSLLFSFLYFPFEQAAVKNKIDQHPLCPAPAEHPVCGAGPSFSLAYWGGRANEPVRP
jgi:hypothetical protein